MPHHEYSTQKTEQKTVKIQQQQQQQQQLAGMSGARRRTWALARRCLAAAALASVLRCRSSCSLPGCTAAFVSSPGAAKWLLAGQRKGSGGGGLRGHGARERAANGLRKPPSRCSPLRAVAALLQPFETTIGGGLRIRTANLGEDLENTKGECSLLLRGPPAPKAIELAQESEELESAVLVIDDVRTGERVGVCGAFVLDGMMEYFVCGRVSEGSSSGEKRSADALQPEVAVLAISSLHSRLLSFAPTGPPPGSIAGGWKESWLRLLGLGGSEREEGGEEEEMVDWVDGAGDLLLPLPRSTIHKFNLLHRGAGILVTDSAGSIYVHRRTDTKRIFPGLNDMFIGGVSLAGESTAVTAQREVAEELSLKGGRARLRYLFSVPITTSYNRCLVDVYSYMCEDGEEESICWQPEEVAWGKMMSMQDVTEWAGGEPEAFVPDGLQVWKAYLEYEQQQQQGRG